MPAAFIGRAALGPGQKIRIASVLTTHVRAYRVEWAADLRLVR